MVDGLRDEWLDGLGGSVANWFDTWMKYCSQKNRETNQINMTTTVDICFICIRAVKDHEGRANANSSNC